MEQAEGVITSVLNILKRSKPSKSAPETYDAIPGWDFEYYREYILGLSRSREFLLPIAEHPSRIDVNATWHEVFNSMRHDARERWALIGYEDGMRRLVLPKVAEVGLSHSVPYEVMRGGLEKARRRAGITDMVGDIHSHPADTGDPGWKIPKKITSSGEAAFSIADMFGFLSGIVHQQPSVKNRFIMCVVQGNENIMALASRESLVSVRNSFTGSYEDFARSWYNKFRWEYKGNIPLSQGGGELADPLPNSVTSLWGINKGIAHQYQLVLYRGFTDTPLLRDYPARITIK